ncbi:Zinc finger CCCH domain-containing protein [Asimina triloba]
MFARRIRVERKKTEEALTKGNLNRPSAVLTRTDNKTTLSDGFIDSSLMANPLYGYGSSYGGSGLSSVYSSRLSSGSANDPYLSEESPIRPSRYLSSDPLSANESSKTKYSVLDRGSIFRNQSDGSRFSGSEIGGTGSLTASRVAAWAGINSYGGLESSFPAAKRSASEASVSRKTAALVFPGFSLWILLFLFGPCSNSTQQQVFSRPSCQRNAVHTDIELVQLFNFFQLPITHTTISSSMPGQDLDFMVAVNGTLYHQSILGSHSSIGQSEALFSTNTLSKRPRFESTSNLPIYPQRPGEKDCAYYMLTRTCKFGDSCKFDHPIWVPEGGIPDWKETTIANTAIITHVPLVPTIESLPERPGEPDCPYFLKTQKCKFGPRCKFNHPKDDVLYSSAVGNDVMGVTVDALVLPERPSEPECSYFMKTGQCKFGANCKYHHPKDIEIPSGGQDPSSGEHNVTAAEDDAATGDVKKFAPFTPALLHNSKGLPIRPGEADCPFYLKTGSCKYGANCRFNHPDRHAINPPVAHALAHTLMTSPAANLIINPTAAILPTIDPRLTQAVYYMKMGECKFGERCKFHHPIDRSAPAASMIQQAQQNIKLSLAGFPRREGAVMCAFYLKTGTCKYGAACRFDHPPPGEVVAMAKAHGLSGEEKEIETTNMEETAAATPMPVDALAPAAEQ